MRCQELWICSNGKLRVQEPACSLRGVEDQHGNSLGNVLNKVQHQVILHRKGSVWVCLCSISG